MLFEDEDYIVKAKNINVDIKQSIMNKYKSIRYFIYAGIFVFIILLIMSITAKDIKRELIFNIGFFIMATVVIILENSWRIKIYDRTIYIRNHSGRHKIKYKDLISFQIYRRGRTNEKVAKFKYLKRNKCVSVILPLGVESEAQFEQIFNSFITKDDIEKGIQISKEYFDIRDDEENDYIEKKSGKKINILAFYIMILIVLIIVFFVNLMVLFKIIK